MKTKTEKFKWECSICKSKGKGTHDSIGDAARAGLIAHGSKHESGVMVESTAGRYIGLAVGINFHVTR